MSTYLYNTGIPGSLAFYPTPAPASDIIGSSSFQGQSSDALFFRPKGGKASSCSACSSNLSSSGGSSSASMGDVFSPEGESRFCGKCFCTWLLAGIILLLILFSGDDE